MIDAWLRADGRKGIRNTIVVAYLVECAHFVASEIVHRFRNTPFEGEVQLIGFPGCYPNEYAAQMMEKLCTHPNVGAVLFVSLGCESFDKVRVANAVDASGRPVKTLVIQRAGGTRSTVQAGADWITQTLGQIATGPRA
ncbi:UxaA family hydrolase, partial [Cypionkella sp.]|uniref:UxaA family hydrolase n=1 Tax=Cypionkella sp. TaxID=2811411 RepID=UPI002624F4D3